MVNPRGSDLIWSLHFHGLIPRAGMSLAPLALQALFALGMHKGNTERILLFTVQNHRKWQWSPFCSDRDEKCHFCCGFYPPTFECCCFPCNNPVILKSSGRGGIKPFISTSIIAAAWVLEINTELGWKMETANATSYLISSIIASVHVSVELCLSLMQPITAAMLTLRAELLLSKSRSVQGSSSPVSLGKIHCREMKSPHGWESHHLLKIFIHLLSQRLNSQYLCLVERGFGTEIYFIALRVCPQSWAGTRLILFFSFHGFTAERDHWKSPNSRYPLSVSTLIIATYPNSSEIPVFQCHTTTPWSTKSSSKFKEWLI